MWCKKYIDEPGVMDERTHIQAEIAALNYAAPIKLAGLYQRTVFFTVRLHVMQRTSVRLSVKRVHCDRTK